MATIPTKLHPSKVILPYVRRKSAEEQSHLDPFLLAPYRERREMLQRFKQALDLAAIEHMEADNE